MNYTDYSTVCDSVDKMKAKVWGIFDKIDGPTDSDGQDFRAIIDTLDGLLELARSRYLEALDNRDSADGHDEPYWPLLGRTKGVKIDVST